MKALNYKKYLKREPLYIDSNIFCGSQYCMFEFETGIPEELFQLSLQSRDDIRQAVDLDYRHTTLEYKYSIKHSQYKYKHYYKVDCKEYAGDDVYITIADRYNDLVENAITIGFVGQLRAIKCIYRDFVVYVMPLRICEKILD